MEKSYLNFLKSKLKSKIEFLDKYGVLFPELFIDEDLRFLRSIRLAELNILELEELQSKVAGIESQIEKLLKSYSPENLKIS